MAGDATLLVRSLRAALSDKRWDDAGTALSHLKLAAPFDPEVRGLELRWLNDTRRTQEAVELANVLVRDHPSSAGIQFQAGRAAYAAREYESARSRFEQSERLHPSRWSRLWLGKALTQLGRFGEAEPLLLEAIEAGLDAELDLAWLQERKGDVSVALATVERWVARHPGAEVGERTRERLKARVIDPKVIVDEIEQLEALGEALPEHLLPRYFESLLETAQSPRARERLRTMKLSERAAIQIGWICRNHEAADLAFEAFMRGFKSAQNNAKFLMTIESLARKLNRVADLISTYAEHAPMNPRLYGRKKALERSVSRG
ncbi:MAG: hypothetical protein HY791_18060 [Deltaproteobacteria bacterium]|nr:hypothetical protein [Deltaproteobacteria bacterium]